MNNTCGLYLYVKLFTEKWLHEVFAHYGIRLNERTSNSSDRQCFVDFTAQKKQYC